MGQYWWVMHFTHCVSDIAINYLRSAGGVTSEQFPYHEDTAQATDNQATDQAAYRNDQPCEIYQQAGDIVFIPRHWSHQVRCAC